MDEHLIQRSDCDPDPNQDATESAEALLDTQPEVSETGEEIQPDGISSGQQHGALPSEPAEALDTVAPSESEGAVRKLSTVGISRAKLAANRENAKKSSGPKTAEGKRFSRKNAIRHGLTATKLLIDPTVDPNATSIIEQLCAEFQPGSVAQQLHLDNLALVILRIQRLGRLEREALDQRFAFQANGTGRLIQFISLTQKQLATAVANWEAMLAQAETISGDEEDDLSQAAC